ncbi:MAG: replication initiator protein A [Gemmataceae bacterium]
MTPLEPHQRRHDGRDEMNLADFPISALPRAQKTTATGGKLDRIEFKATRYDAVSRQRLDQRVTLTSTAHDGLPTPADEHVILALLHVAKHSTDFEDATVHFAPSQLFAIMGWTPNGRSYTRLRNVLRRLKALTIRYQNAWWDIVGRAYEEEVATGIISGYRIARQVSGPRRPDQPLLSWVTWTQAFHDSLRRGNLKRLDLDVFFRLQSPTAQRMYRFLDKRFYTTPNLSIDLVEFACGHIGLTDAGNVAILKRRLAPAIEELERIGFIRPAPPEGRFQKLKVGQWRIVFQANSLDEEAPTPSLPTAAPAPAPTSVAPPDARTLAREFYRLWDPAQPAQPGGRDLEQVGLLMAGRSWEDAQAILTLLVQVTRREWPECRSLSGAVQKYLGEALKLQETLARREATRREQDQAREAQRQQQQARLEQTQRLEQRWLALPLEERQAIEARIRERVGQQAPQAFVHRLCLQELA